MLQQELKYLIKFFLNNSLQIEESVFHNLLKYNQMMKDRIQDLLTNMMNKITNCLLQVKANKDLCLQVKLQESQSCQRYQKYLNNLPLNDIKNRIFK